jgi:N-acetyl-anhydromuramyl-L-alanine amidase AmpD
MINITKLEHFKNFDKNKNKKQIILCDSFRNSLDYVSSLKNRNNGKYNKIPNYLITRDGKVINILPDDSYSNFFEESEINKNSIIICLENLGWLEKVPLSHKFYSWIGEEFGGEVFERKWREKIFWQKYTEEQYNSLRELSSKLTKKFSINKSFIGHNTKVDGIKIFNGIVCRSNYNNKFTDPNPSFDFDGLKNFIENERN